MERALETGDLWDHGVKYIYNTEVGKPLKTGFWFDPDAWYWLRVRSSWTFNLKTSKPFGFCHSPFTSITTCPTPSQLPLLQQSVQCCTYVHFADGLLVKPVQSAVNMVGEEYYKGFKWAGSCQFSAPAVLKSRGWDGSISHSPFLPSPSVLKKKSSLQQFHPSLPLM